jgi:uncharacterized membrane protein YraQ (UPF0718 family)
MVVTKDGVMFIDAVVAPLLQLYVSAPVTVKVLFSPLHMAVLLAVAVKFGLGLTTTCIEPVLGQLMPEDEVNAAKVYIVVAVGLT